MPQTYDYGTLEVKPKPKSYDFGALEQTTKPAQVPAPIASGPMPYVGPDDWRYPIAEGVRAGAEGVSNALSGAGNFLSSMIHHPLDTIAAYTAPVSAGPQIETTGPNAYQLPPDPVLRTGGTILRNAGALLFPSQVQQATPERNKEAQGFAGETAASAIVAKGLESAPKVGAAVSNAATQLKARSAGKTSAFEVDSLAAIGRASGKENPTYFPAKDSAPFAKQAAVELGIDPKAAFPSKGTTQTLVTGDPAQLAKANAVLQAEHAASGSTKPFVPAPSLQTALADRMLDVADRPIRNAVDAVATHSTAAEAASVANKLRGTANRLVGSDALKSKLIDWADTIQQHGDTVAGLQDLKSLANEAYKESRFPSATEPAVQDAAFRAGSAIREELYPFLEKNTSAKGLAEAGRTEASVFDQRDGMYQNWRDAANAHVKESSQTFRDIVRGNSENIVRRPTDKGRISAAVGTAVGKIIGDSPSAIFNERLRNGIGDIRNFTPMNSSVVATTPSVTGGYPRGRGQATPLNVPSTTQGMPQSLMPQSPVQRGYPEAGASRGYTPTQGPPSNAAEALMQRRGSPEGYPSPGKSKGYAPTQGGTSPAVNEYLGIKVAPKAEKVLFDYIDKARKSHVEVKPETIPNSVVQEMATAHMQQFADLVSNGATEMTGKMMGASADERYGWNYDAASQFEPRIGKGGIRNSTPLTESAFPEAPGVIAKAIRSGKGALFARIQKAFTDYAAQYIQDQFDKETGGWTE